MNLLFSTADPSNALSHKIIVEAVKKSESKARGVDLELVVMNKAKSLSSYFRLTMLFLKSVLTNKFFGRAATNLSYRGVSIGKYAVSEALRHPNAYLNKKTYYTRFCKALWNCVLNVDNYMKIQDKVAACYINDPGYSNGVYFELAVLNNTPFYHNTYPYRLTRFVPKPGAKSVEACIVHSVSAENKIEIGKEILEQITASTEKIDYMSTVEFQSRDVSFSEVDAVVYAHSFTDSQQSYGGDTEFLNMYEWLLYTLNKLQDKKVILKAHPGFFRKDYLAEVIEWDRIIFEKFVKQIADQPNLTIIDWPMRNNELLSRLSKNCTLISHHGNALLEGAGQGFKCISSSASAWKNYDLFNTWLTKKQYDEMLENFNELHSTKLENLNEYVFDLYKGECSFFHEHSWRQIVEKETGIKASQISTNRSVLASLSPTDINQVSSSISSKIGTVTLEGE